MPNTQSFANQLGMMDTINEMWAAKGNDHNAEWAGAAPEEYWMRKYGEALAWKRNQLEIKAQQAAELRRKQVEAEKAKLQGEAQRRKDEFQAKTTQYRQQFSDALIGAQNQNKALAEQLGLNANDQKSYLGGLLSSLLGSYDTAFNNLQSKAGDFSNNIDSLINQADLTGENYSNANASDLMQNINTYTPNLYLPNIQNLAAAGSTIEPLLGQGLNRMKETYGWNPDRVKQETQPIIGQYGNQYGMLSNMVNSLGNSVANQLTGMPQAGLYQSSRYNDILSQEANVSQQLRQQEQGVLSQLNSMYNLASTYSNQAENAFNSEKANRLQERSGLLAQQQENKLGTQLGQMESNAAQQVNKRRQATDLSFSPNNYLLSYLTRGT